MPRCTPIIPILTLASAAGLALPSAAPAAFFPGDPVDGPADIRSVGDVDIARDGTGGVAYVKRENGADRVYVARLERGVWSAPAAVDIGLGGATGTPVVAASDGGRLVVAFESGGSLFTAVRAAGAPGFTPPQLVALGGRLPAAGMSINGVAYVSFTVPGASAADVRVARLRRAETTFTVLPEVLDVDPARDAGDGDGRSKVAVSADSTAVVVWAEDGADGRRRVIGRRVFGERISTAPQELSLPELEGRAGRDADLPDLDIEDDSSYAWAVFRQGFQDGLSVARRTITRRLVGSQFEAPTVVDDLGFPAADQATAPRVELSGRGAGFVMSAHQGSGALVGVPIHDDKPFPPVRIGSAGVLSRPVPTFPENGLGVIAAFGGSPGAATVRAFPWKIAFDRRTVEGPGGEVTLSRPEFGPVDPAAGLDAGANRAGDVVALFVQAGADGRRLMSGTFDRTPGTFRTYTTSRFRRFAKPPLSWSPAFELWGPVNYTVLVDGTPVGSTQDTKITLPVAVADGLRRWQVVATDRRGQTSRTKTGNLRVDARKPRLTVTVGSARRAGQVVRVRVRASDAAPGGVRASGLARVRVDWGDRSRPVTLTRNSFSLGHRYSRGRRTLRISATDKAGNSTVVRRTLTIRAGG